MERSTKIVGDTSPRPVRRPTFIPLIRDIPIRRAHVNARMLRQHPRGSSNWARQSWHRYWSREHRQARAAR